MEREKPDRRPWLQRIRGKNRDLNKDIWDLVKRQTKVLKLLTTNVAEGHPALQFTLVRI